MLPSKFEIFRKPRLLGAWMRHIMSCSICVFSTQQASSKIRPG